ncbi:hypothetical protein D9M70_522630 [compost metagenome]
MLRDQRIAGGQYGQHGVGRQPCGVIHPLAGEQRCHALQATLERRPVVQHELLGHFHHPAGIGDLVLKQRRGGENQVTQVAVAANVRALLMQCYLELM